MRLFWVNGTSGISKNGKLINPLLTTIWLHCIHSSFEGRRFPIGSDEP